jgi:predicted RNA-binding Zn-ribbon protein involved in translation (DUF1610 family)
VSTERDPIPMLLWCPECGERHIDRGEFATKAHHTHACEECGMVWRPAIVATCGVQFLPGFKNAEEPAGAECTGVAASWCPVCGDCACPRQTTGERDGESASCPLHGPDSTHGEGVS